MSKEHWALIALLVNLLQSLAKFVGGVLSGSLSLIGEAVHSLSDSFASVITYISIKFSNKRTERFPYGLYKLENLASVVISFFLFLASYEIIKRAFSQRVEIKEEFWGIGAGIVVFSLFSSLSLSMLERWAGKRYNSPALIADSYHTLTDAFGSSLVLLSFVSAKLGYQLDRYFAMAVSLLILWTAISILKREFAVLLDVSADEKTLERIRQIILDFENIKEIKHLYVRSSGGRLFADITVAIEGWNFHHIHQMVDALEERLKREIPELEMVFIHYEPVGGMKPRVGVLLDEEQKVSSNFENTKYLAIFSDGKRELLKEISGDEREISQILADSGVNIVVCGWHPEDQTARLNLSRAGIFVWETEEKNPYIALSQIAKCIKECKDG
jgi:cation diffusion facilitator family transporter